MFRGQSSRRVALPLGICLVCAVIALLLLERTKSEMGASPERRSDEEGTEHRPEMHGKPDGGSAVGPATPLAGATVQLTVRDRGVPAAGAKCSIRLKSPRLVETHEHVADINGEVSFAVTRLPSVVKMTATSAHDELLRTTAVLRVTAPRHYEREIDIDGAVIRGVVTASDGTPIRKARVSLFVDRDDRDATWTDENGRYAIVRIPEATELLVTARGFRYAVAAVGDSVAQDFVLEPSPLMHGRVLDAAGNPVEGARLSAIVVYRGAHSPWPGSRHVTGSDIYVSNGRSLTDAQGRFEWFVPLGCTLEGTISLKDHAPHEFEIEVKTMQHDFGSVTMSRSDLVGEFGTVLRRDGSVAPHVVVYVQENEIGFGAKTFAKLVTDEEGRFRLAELPEGRVVRFGLSKDDPESDVIDYRKNNQYVAEIRAGLIIRMDY